MISLYAAIVPSNRQMLEALLGLLARAEAWCVDEGIEPAALIDARLIADMQPFAYQVKSATVHSIGAIEGVRRGSFSPDWTPSPETFPDLRARLSSALAALAAIDEAEIDGFVGRDMLFTVRERRDLYSAEDFLLSFAQPNFYFHVTAAYALLRAAGLPIGKRDYLGQMRKRPDGPPPS
jgi:hypothetical protein